MLPHLQSDAGVASLEAKIQPDTQSDQLVQLQRYIMKDQLIFDVIFQAMKKSVAGAGEFQSIQRALVRKSIEKSASDWSP